MIVSAVADPTAFGPSGITDELSKREAIAFLNGIVANGVLLDEPTKELLRLAINEASQLSTNMGQRLQLLLVEIKKQHKKLVVTCDQSRWQQQNTSTIPLKCAAVAEILNADLIVTQAEHLAAIQTAVVGGAEISLLRDASQTRFEVSRLRLQQIPKPLDELTLAEIEEFVGRAFKYASTIRFFDYRMIGSRQRTSKYVAGLQFFIAIWARWCVVGHPNSRRVEVYTVGNTQTQNGFLDGAAADALLASSIQEPLKAATGATVDRFVKEDRQPAIFHARGFEAHCRAFTIDPGFDAVAARGAIRRCLLKVDLAAESHFADCRKLKGLP